MVGFFCCCGVFLVGFGVVFLGLVHYFYMQLIFMDAYVGSLWFVVLRVFLPCLLSLSVTFFTPFCMIAFCVFPAAAFSSLPVDLIPPSSHFYVH